MSDTIDWENIIVYHEVPFFTPSGFYQFKYNKIYIHKLVKEYQEFHRYILAHEKEHYINNNSESSFFKKIFRDISIDINGNRLIGNNKELYEEIKLFKKKKRDKELDNNIRIHYFITKNLRLGAVLVWLPLLVVFEMIMRIHYPIINLIINSLFG